MNAPHSEFLCHARGNCPRLCSGQSAPAALARELERGDLLFRSGDNAGALFVVRSGAVKTCRLGEDGSEQILGFYLPGEIVGFDAITQGRYVADAMALKATQLCRIACQPAASASGDGSLLPERLMTGFGQEVQRLQNLLVLERCSAEQRLARFLLQMADKQARLGRSSRYVSLPMARGDIGRFLHLATETVSRMFTRLAGLGWIRIEGSGVEILDAAALAGSRPQPALRRDRPALPQAA
ncbi:MAG: cyclic nucleotide-binding domain-containing protein [Nevskiaceae bacterium]|nr:MAG: cyclic nucleotide-binding domain-containing protein [Nevskiaceae bacterium]